MKTMQTLRCCPVCSRPDALLALGVRRDHPHRWRPWVTTLTQLYLCDRCDALVAVDGTAGHGRGDRSPTTWLQGGGNAVA